MSVYSGRDVFEDSMVEAKAKAKARGLRGQGQRSSRPRPRPGVFKAKATKFCPQGVLEVRPVLEDPIPVLRQCSNRTRKYCEIQL